MAPVGEALGIDKSVQDHRCNPVLADQVDRNHPQPRRWELPG